MSTSTGEDHFAPDGVESWLYHPEYPADWRRCSLHSLAKWVNGLAFRDIQFTPTGLPVIKIAEIKGGISGQTKFTEQSFNESVRVRPGDLLFSWSGQPETSIDAFWWRGPEGWLNQHVFRVTPVESIDRTFFFYLLRYLNPNFVAIARNKQTTGLGHITKRDLESIEAAYPELPEQRAIAHVLGTLDDKIELNRRMNDTLEGIARTLFRSWFVDFDPVRAKMDDRQPPGIQAELVDMFPASLVESAFGLIPEGWRVLVVGDVAKVNELTLGSGHALNSIRYIDIASVSAGEISEVALFQRGAEPSRARRRLQHGDTVMSTVRPDRGSYFLSLAPPDDLIASTGFATVSPKQVPWSFLHAALTRDAVFEHLGHVADGAAYPAVRPSVIENLELVVPERNEILGAYHRLAQPLFERVDAIRCESHRLVDLRDSLLPRLISGELRLKDYEGAVNG